MSFAGLTLIFLVTLTLASSKSKASVHAADQEPVSCFHQDKVSPGNKPADFILKTTTGHSSEGNNILRDGCESHKTSSE